MVVFAEVIARIVADQDRCRDSEPTGASGAVLVVADRCNDLVTLCSGSRQSHATDGTAPPAPLPDPPAMTADAVFDLASVTKAAVTTPLLLAAADAGRLDLDAPARDWLPGLDSAATVRDLLEHRGGLWEWWPVYAELAAAGLAAPGAAAGGAAALDVVCGLPARYPVGAGRRYSDLGFMLLGGIAAAVHGAPLEVAAARELFEPLGLRSAGYRRRAAHHDAADPDAAAAVGSAPLVATAHGDWYEQRMLATGEPYPVPLGPDATGAFTGWRRYTLLGEVHDGNAWHAFGGVAGHAGLFGTAADLVGLGRALLDALAGDGPWSRDVVRRFVAPGRTPAQGLGFVRWPKYGAVGHTGFTGARFAVLPAVERIVVLLTNRVHAVGAFPSLDPAWDAILAAVAGGQPAGGPPAGGQGASGQVASGKDA